MQKLLLKILIIIFFSIPPSYVFGQVGFELKKKSNPQVDVNSLNAKSISAKNNVSGTNSLLQYPAKAGNSLKAAKTSVQDPQLKVNRVIVSPSSNLPIFIETEGNSVSQNKSAVPKTASQYAFQYLSELKALLKLDDPPQNFSIEKMEEDAAGNKHIRLSQIYKGISVYGAEIMIHLDASGNGKLFNGKYYILNQTIDTNPSITAIEAFHSAAGFLLKKNKPLSSANHDNFLTSLEKPVFKLELLNQDNNLPVFKLVYHLTLYTLDHHRWEFFVNAKNGEIIKYYESVCYADGARTATASDLNGVSRTINTYQVGSKYYLMDASRSMYKAGSSNWPDNTVGTIITIDMNNTYGDNQSFKYITTTNNTWNDPKAVSAHSNAGLAYEYYKQKFNRNSIDGNGGNIISIINVPDVETGDPMDNAFWNGKFMCYGNGQFSFKPLAGGLDVAGHEMTHGVVENTAALIYEGESGAINESMADIFGSMMDSEDWLIGEDVVKTSAFPSGALRSLSDPHNGGSNLSDPGFQPKTMNEKYNGSEDNHGVHINSGICNYAFYLLATAIGKEKASGIYYKALTDYLTKSAQFIDLRLAVIQSAKDLYGNSSNEVTQAMNAFSTVGIADGQGTGGDPNLPDNPGSEYVLVYNTDINDANTLYRSNLDKSVVEPLTTTEFISRPSVTDDGSGAVFVAGDNTLHAILTSPDDQPDEFVIQDENIWSNAVISKDGNRLAAVTNYEDTSIYVYDFDTEVWVKFQLYNPTYTEGVNSAGPVYADALEFDYSGEYLVFDCFNRLTNSDGANIEYWNVNFIRVWDNEKNDWGDGEIFKLFSSLPDNVSIGDPSFSKKSPNIIAFDYFSSDPEEYYILGCNIETNDVNTMVQNTTLGWPSFNKDDSRLAFSSYNNNDDPQIDYIFLNPDKISVQGEVQPMFSQAKWPVYFATGERILTDVKDAPSKKSGIEVYPNPFNQNITVTLPSGFKNGKIEIFNNIGQKVYNYTGEYNSLNRVQMELPDLKAGIYYLRMSDNLNTYTTKIIKSDSR